MRSALMSVGLGGVALALLGVFTPDASAWHRRVVVVPATTYYVAPAPVVVTPAPPATAYYSAPVPTAAVTVAPAPAPVLVAQPAPVVVRYRAWLPLRPTVVISAPPVTAYVPGP